MFTSSALSGKFAKKTLAQSDPLRRSFSEARRAGYPSPASFKNRLSLVPATRATCPLGDFVPAKRETKPKSPARASFKRQDWGERGRAGAQIPRWGI
ncbi:MAG: hypothetical protein A3H02_01735 [Candidatus Niyogibacteria bacterium RIFCSPLOWO2_12_FULL_41_13]|uniref:Uncharacterized protein n=1 Tax=Candidatus Niyogibacteria bacterium RIFCSPLOWO2_12_FULL_41_13 TaxID=1801726 RepID=A0A1G2F126_9BACT|nr:MAG: hypothetical protein A3H02_01735 [Candidatus Niyogibacteria bacterium RIFCSPLOWO2_12_FULL_41_13]